MTKGGEADMVTTREDRKAVASTPAPALATGKKATRPKAMTKAEVTGISEGCKATPVQFQVPAARKRSMRQAHLSPSARLVAEDRTGLGVTRELFARLTGFSVYAISDWEAGRLLSEAALRLVKEMQRFRDALAEGMQSGSIPRWLETPCEGLGGRKPVEVLERDEADRLCRTVLLIGSGMPT